MSVALGISVRTIKRRIKENDEIVIFQVRPIAANHRVPECDEDKIESIINMEKQIYS